MIMGQYKQHQQEMVKIDEISLNNYDAIKLILTPEIHVG